MNPLLAELAAEAWAMEPTHLERFLHQVATISLDKLAFFGGESASSKPTELVVRDGVAHIPIQGTIMKSVPRIFRMIGIPATSTTETQDLLARAIEDDRVKSIMLDIESPGGIVKGVEELAADIRAARDLKPVKAHITDLGASAAYWLASQAKTVSANAMGTIGSIGVYQVADDFSRLYEMKGVKVHVIASHELKGAGVQGAPITQNQLADMQRLVDQYAERFVKAVAAGREIDEATIQKSATGQVWLAEEARERALIDAVQTAEAAHKAAIQQPSSTPQATNQDAAPRGTTQEDSMDPEQMKARLAQLEAENKGLQAQVAASTETLKASAVQRREELIAKYRDRIAPSALEHVKAYGESCGTDTAKFEAFLQVLAPVTRPAPAATTPTAPAAPVTTSAEADVARDLGISAKEIEAFSRVKAWRSDGKYLLHDGSVVTRDELLKQVA